MDDRMTVDEMHSMNERIKNSIGAPSRCAIELVSALRKHLADCELCAKVVNYNPVSVAEHLFLEGSGFASACRMARIKNPSKPTGNNILWALRWIKRERIDGR